MENNTQWAGLNIQTDGSKIEIKYSDMTVRQLTNLFIGALQEVPWCLEAMELAIEKTKLFMDRSSRSILIYNLKLLRHSKGFNTYQLAEVLNFQSARISAIENNPKIKIDPVEIEAIAAYFNTDAETLLSVKGVVTFNKTQDNGKES